MNNVRWNIDIGDIVRVDVNSAPLTLTHRAVVKHIPQATGDSWVFVDERDGRVFYVSEGCTITLISRAEEKK